METTIDIQRPKVLAKSNAAAPVADKIIPKPMSSLEKSTIHLLIRLRLLYFGFIVLKNPIKVWKVFKTLMHINNSVSGGALKKLYKVDGKYYVSQYKPGWPSKIYNKYIKTEIRRYGAPETVAGKLSFIFFAITRKCPMQCEHCFEWDNLNQKEAFTREDLFKTVDFYQKQGVQQFHFSGGEPMVRFKDLIAVIEYAGKKSECWVLTSGFNFTQQNAMLLKKAGCKGVVISIDHYIPELHDLFRGMHTAFNVAVNAVAAAHNAGLVISLSVCATKTFIEAGHMMPYMNFAKELGVQFVQVLEPKAVGHYQGKNVMLEEKHIVELEWILQRINHDPAYTNFPAVLYHGFYQRRIGCLSEGRSVYVDSAGDVHSCPFCHNKSYNIIDILRRKEKKLPVKEESCPRYERTV